MKHLKMLGLGVVAAMSVAAFAGGGTASAATLAINGVTQNKSVSIVETLSPGTSIFNGPDTCTGSEIKSETISPFSAAIIVARVTSWTYYNCSHTTTVINNGNLSFTWISGKNATVSSSGTEVTIQSTVFGASAVCKTGTGTDMGTLTGVESGKATMDVNAKISCGILGTVSAMGTYVITSPAGLSVHL